MTNITLTDGTNEVTLYVDGKVKTQPEIKKKSWNIPGLQTPVVQFLQTGNTIFSMSGTFASGQSSTQTVAILQHWHEAGTGAATGTTLTYKDPTNPDPGTTVYISDISWTQIPGQTYTKNLKYILQLTEV